MIGFKLKTLVELLFSKFMLVLYWNLDYLKLYLAKLWILNTALKLFKGGLSLETFVFVDIISLSLAQNKLKYGSSLEPYRWVPKIEFWTKR